MNTALTIGSFVFFTVLVAVATWLIVRRDDTQSKDGYFLAGRNLTFPFIAGSLLLTNLSTEQLVALNGSAYLNGLSVMVWEVVAVIALVMMALFFLPRFLKSGVTTVPQYLELRFDAKTGSICNLLFLTAYAVILLPIILYTGAAGLGEILDIKNLFGFSSDIAVRWTVIWLIGIIGSFYALFGGLKTVAVSDTLNGIGLLTGGFMIVYFGLAAAGGTHGAMAGLVNISEAIPEKLNSIGGNTQEVPFSTIFSGVLLINIFYWCTNQQIIQRTLGARSLAEGQKGVLLTGLLKLFGPLYLVLPGLIAFYLYKQGVFDPGTKANGLPNAELAYGMLVRRVLPAPLTGFFAAVMVGAILSSFNSALNSTCTLFSLGIYKTVIRPDATDAQIVSSGKTFGWIMAFISMSVAPFIADAGSIFDYLQTMNGIYFIPILAVVATGMLTGRVPSFAANWALLGGVAVITIGYFVPPFNLMVRSMQNYHFLGMVFMYLVLFMLTAGAIRPGTKEYIQKDAKILNLTPWKYAKLCGALLFCAVILIYVCFADFSILR